MHARFNYVDVKPDGFAEMDPYWRDTVDAYGEQLVRGWFLRAGDSVHTLSLVLFADEATAVENTEGHLGAAAGKVARLRLSEPRVHLAPLVGSTPPVVPATPGVATVDLGAARAGPVLTGPVPTGDWLAEGRTWREVPGFAGACWFGPGGDAPLTCVCFWESPAHIPARDAGSVVWQVRVDVGAQAWPELKPRGA